MFMTLLVGGFVLLCGITCALLSTLGRRKKDDLGTISDNWVHQHRTTTHDQRR